MIFRIGWGHHGQLGHGTTESESIPRKVYLPDVRVSEDSFARTEFTQAACGSFHTVAVTPEGVVFAFGLNKFGQLGVALPMSLDRVSVPMLIKSLENYQCTRAKATSYR